MIKLKTEKTPMYLSPSSVMQFMNQINTFYMTRLLNEPMPRDPQGKAAACGSAFDYLIKCRLWRDGIGLDKIHLKDSLLKGIECPGFRDEALSIGQNILDEYCLTAYDMTVFKNVELWGKFTFGDIPMYVKLDGTYDDEEFVVEAPLDWKCSGFNPDNKNGMSPKPGYYIQYEGRKIKGAHAKYIHNMPFEVIDYKWAIQMCTYGWFLGLSPKLEDSFPARIDMCTITKTRKIKISSYRGILTPEFQKKVFEHYQDAWTSLLSGEVINRLASQYDVNHVYNAASIESWF